jgi:hypothetical protein
VHLDRPSAGPGQLARLLDGHRAFHFDASFCFWFLMA